MKFSQETIIIKQGVGIQRFYPYLEVKTFWGLFTTQLPIIQREDYGFYDRDFVTTFSSLTSDVFNTKKEALEQAEKFLEWEKSEKVMSKPEKKEVVSRYKLQNFGDMKK